jgi:hypothetical protein
MRLLQNLVALTPQGGASGVLVHADLNASNMDQILSHDTFRPDLPRAVSIRDIWPFLLLVAAFLFLADVFVRRVTLTADWVAPALRWIREQLVGDRDRQPIEERLERLRSKKAEVAQSIDQRRAATRFEPQVDEDPADQPAPDLSALAQDPTARTGARKPPEKDSQASTIDASESDSYTSRLLEAKKKARQEQQRKRKNE